ncbi:hypothetical protein [Priestia megaterium]|uniref:hypothetical protein n=1 Tax=Priestia megaterium TaxID=1404 RepID=UPI000BF5BA8E|nr:hypothetical protein [Priestia megaterium]PFR88904.1 hypothetical protein COK39_25675 [Priestia megaterium]
MSFFEKEVYKLEEVATIFIELGLTKNIQTVRRWVREGKLIATYRQENNRKKGQVVTDEHIVDFLAEEAPGTLELMNKITNLERKVRILEKKLYPDKEEPVLETLPVPPVMKDMSFKRSDVHKISGINKGDKKNVIDYLFTGVPDGQSITVSIEENKNLRDYINNLFVDNHFKLFLEDDFVRENFLRKKRGEISMSEVEKKYTTILNEKNLSESLNLDSDTTDFLYYKHLCPAFEGYKTSYYTDLKRGNLFINTFTKEKFKSMDKAIESMIIHVFNEDYIKKIDKTTIF